MLTNHLLLQRYSKRKTRAANSNNNNSSQVNSTQDSFDIMLFEDNLITLAQ